MDRTTAERAGWRTYPIVPGVQVRITGTMPPLPPRLDDVVERHWQAARAEHPLFNGMVFCADTVAPALITGHWTEYRRVVAQMRDPGLRDALRVRSLAVCAVTRCADGVLLGRRSAHTPYQAGAWQLPPAGSVDQACADGQVADIRRAVLLELQEEVGIPAEAADTVQPLCLIEHPGGVVLDLGLRITTRLPAAAVLAAHAAAGNREYDQILVVPEDDAAAAVRRLGGDLAWPALIMLAEAHRHAATP